MTVPGSILARLLFGALSIGQGHALLAAATSIPAGSPNCSLAEPPADAGAYATPGGFLLVHPRNQAIRPDYTGCKSFWIMDMPDQVPLYLRLYFANGKLRLAQVFDKNGNPTASCDAGAPNQSCQGMEDSPLTGLYLDTWPRVCTENADLAVCAGDPE